jgi:hypothetical protein
MLIDDLRAAIPQGAPRSASLLPGLRLGRILRSRSLMFPLAMIAMFSVFPFAIAASDPQFRLSRGDRARATGRVDSVDEGTACGQRPGVALRYSFPDPAGVVFRGQQNLCPESPYARSMAGSAVPIVFLADDPSVNAIAGSGSSAPPVALLSLFPLLASFFVLPLVAPRLRQLFRDRKLFRVGSLATGRVVFVVQQQDSGWPGVPAPTRAEVFVRLADGSLPEREVKAICTNDWLLLHLAPGTEVTVCARGTNAVLLENYFR